MKTNSPMIATPESLPTQASAVAESRRLTSGRLLAGNAVWNLLGTCSPIVFAVVCLPLLKRVLGTDRLGLITLAWVIVGYFGIFDLGLSRAVTKLVAEKIGQERSHEIPSLVWTSLFLMAGIGFVGLIVALLFSSWVVSGPLRVPAELRHETLVSFYWLSLSVPAIVVTAGLRGVLEALQRFRLATAIRVPMGIFTYLGPVLVLPFSHSLVPILATLVLGRFVATAAHLWACFRAFPALRGSMSFHRASVRPLVHFGGWMTVTNIVGPLMVSADRFFIGAILSVSAVAYYAVPYELVTRFGLFPSALVAVLFPAFSTALELDRNRLVFLYECGLKYIFLALFPVTLILIAFAPEGLRLWVGADFARNSTHVAQLLAVAIFVNSLGQIPFAHVQGAGRPDITAKLHLLELPFYAAALLYFARTLGITGVALAWLLRVCVDSAVLFVISWKILPQNRFLVSRLPLITAGALVVFGYAAWPAPLLGKAVVSILICVFATYATWRWMISPGEKSAILSSLRLNPAAAWARRKR
jgi:O-antigen/teichoic acid export membrane protein